MQKVKTDKMLSKLGQLNDEQFKVLFFIYNSINLNSDNTNRVKIYRAVLADLTGKSERTISRITDKLAEQGLIVKDCVSDGSKLYNYYGIPTSEKEEKVDNEKQKAVSNLVTDDRVKEHERTRKNIKELKDNKSNINDNIIENNKINNLKDLQLYFINKIIEKTKNNNISIEDLNSLETNLKDELKNEFSYIQNYKNVYYIISNSIKDKIEKIKEKEYSIILN